MVGGQIVWVLITGYKLRCIYADPMEAFNMVEGDWQETDDGLWLNDDYPETAEVFACGVEGFECKALLIEAAQEFERRADNGAEFPDWDGGYSTAMDQAANFCRELAEGNS